MIENTIAHDTTGEGGTGAGVCEEQQAGTATDQTCALATNLMEKICAPANLNRAYKRVKANKGAAGVDGMTVEELRGHLRDHKEAFLTALRDGSYRPQPVKQVMIPKAGGGERQLGIPTVLDRLVQQAILQVLNPIFDPTFSKSSYGFRPGRDAHQALKQAQKYVQEGYVWVVDTDLEKFFDRVNHDMLMSRVARKIGDKEVLRLIRRFLTAGIMVQGVVVTSDEGTPQGGPLSPLLSNILLDDLDKELERRGHKFCRYADDQNIYVRSKRAGERVFASTKKFLETKLKLKVNDQKSAVAKVNRRKFLGYRIREDGSLTVSAESVKRLKDKIRRITRRNRGWSLEAVLRQLNQYLQGWLSYYRLVANRNIWEGLDGWIRRRLRSYKLKQLKLFKPTVRFLVSRGVNKSNAKQIGSSGKGYWRLSIVSPVNYAMNKRWFNEQGLMSLYRKSEEWLNV